MRIPRCKSSDNNNRGDWTALIEHRANIQVNKRTNHIIARLNYSATLPASGKASQHDRSQIPIKRQIPPSLSVIFLDEATDNFSTTRRTRRPAGEDQPVQFHDEITELEGNLLLTCTYDLRQSALLRRRGADLPPHKERPVKTTTPTRRNYELDFEKRQG